MSPSATFITAISAADSSPRFHTNHDAGAVSVALHNDADFNAVYLRGTPTDLLVFASKLRTIATELIAARS
jgi:hypothetical protein